MDYFTSYKVFNNEIMVYTVSNLSDKKCLQFTFIYVFENTYIGFLHEV